MVRKLQKLQTRALPALFILCGDEDSTVRSQGIQTGVSVCQSACCRSYCAAMVLSDWFGVGSLT